MSSEDADRAIEDEFGDPTGAAGNALFAQVWDEYVGPAAERAAQLRPEEARGDTFGVYSWQVIFSDGASEVRINGEVKGTAQVTALRAFVAGEEVAFDEVGDLSGFELASDDAGASHVTGLCTATGWFVAFAFDDADPQRFTYLDIAGEFAMAAHAARDAGHLRAFAENAFAAAEALVSAELLNYGPTARQVRARKRSKHQFMASLYNGWAALGNTDVEHAGLLNRLLALRKNARYADGRFALDVASAEHLALELDALDRHVRGLLLDSNKSPRSYNLIAARDVQAGSLVRPADVRLWPAKARAPRVEDEATPSGGGVRSN